MLFQQNILSFKFVVEAKNLAATRCSCRHRHSAAAPPAKRHNNTPAALVRRAGLRRQFSPLRPHPITRRRHPAGLSRQTTPPRLLTRGPPARPQSASNSEAPAPQDHMAIPGSHRQQVRDSVLLFLILHPPPHFSEVLLFFSDLKNINST